MSPKTLKKKRKAGRCLTPFCRRKARHQRRYCCTCRDRKWRTNNPMRYLLKSLRGHAKARGIDFALTYDQWVQFCQRTGYHLRVGQNPESATIDRIKSDRGYYANNIRVISHAVNSTRQDQDEDEEQPF